VTGRIAWLVGAIVVGCGSAPPPTAAASPPDTKAAAPQEAPVAGSTATVDVPAEPPPPSTASYEEALSTPESLDVHDERAHLTDVQLTGPMRGVLSGCSVPSNARVTIKTAVQRGRAIGVTVTVRFERPKSAKPLSKAAAKAESKRSMAIVACVDRAVRVLVWPPSNRRDSFTTEY
jgi:hypothetical protein